MRFERMTVGMAMALCLTLTPVEAASNGKGQAPAKVTSSKAPTKAKATPPPKTTKTATNATKSPKVTTTAKASGTPKTSTAKTTKTSETKTANTETRSAKKSGVTSTTAPTTTAAIDFTQGKVGERLTKNTKLAEKLRNQLTALGYTGDVYQAGYGFKNLGQLVATVNNAQNHQLSFEQLKTLMTGLTVDKNGVVLYANRNQDGTVSMVPIDKLTNPAPTESLGQAKKTIGVAEAEPTTTTGTK
jgi:carboxypeptidase C (cathepsin A)